MGFAGALAVGAILAGGATAVAPGETGRAASCVEAGKPLPGSGPLEWKPVPGLSRRVPWSSSPPVARIGNTLVFAVRKTINGVERPGLAALDARSLRLLPFSVTLPDADTVTDEITDIAASATTVFVAYSDKTLSYSRPEVRAFDLRTGAMLPKFRLTEYADGMLTATVYARGNLIVAGSTRFDRGHPLVAYDAVTGRPVWRVGPGWWGTSATTDGSRVFVGVPKWVRGQNLVAAFDAATGRRIAGWGKSLRPPSWDGMVYGVDATRVFGTKGPRPFAVTRADGRLVTLPHLPARAFRLYYGTRRMILGVLLAPSGASTGAVYSSSGRLVGTICSRYQLLALRDDRHVIVADNFLEPGRATLYLLRRP